MNNFTKLVLAGAAGYGIRTVMTRNKEERKVYKPEPLHHDNTLAQKIAGAVSDHLVEKINEVLYKSPPSRYARTYPNN